MEEAVETLLAERALSELLFRTLEALDRCDWATYREGLVDDVEFDFTEHSAAPPEAREIIRGPEAIVAGQRSVMEGFDVAQHYVTNVIHHVDGDTATTECYLYAEHFLKNDRGDPSVTLGGKYEIHTRRGAAGWKVVRWRFFQPWLRGNPMLYVLATEITRDNALRLPARPA